ncbi:MAG: FHA domain-containing protein, partial [Anaerolineae bacterium]|nr:FHA domain-containing protein [Anaerolineae bacterium]
ACPDVDLTHTGSANSISRQHARILRRGNSVLVEDSGSFNGTFVNGKKLDPYLPERLNDGDTLQLGDVLIEVELS